MAVELLSHAGQKTGGREEEDAAHAAADMLESVIPLREVQKCGRVSDEHEAAHEEKNAAIDKQNGCRLELPAGRTAEQRGSRGRRSNVRPS